MKKGTNNRTNTVVFVFTSPNKIAFVTAPKKMQRKNHKAQTTVNELVAVTRYWLTEVVSRDRHANARAKICALHLCFHLYFYSIHVISFTSFVPYFSAKSKSLFTSPFYPHPTSPARIFHSFVPDIARLA